MYQHRRSQSYDVQRRHNDYDNPVMASFSEYTEDIIPSRAPQKPAHVFVVEDNNSEPGPPSSRRQSERSANLSQNMKLEKRKGVFLSRSRILLWVLLVVLLFLIIGILAGLANWNELEPVNAQNTIGTIGTTLDPSIPYHRPRLPENVKPSRYDLNIVIDPLAGIFSGSVSIDIRCTENTRYIILHVFLLTIDPGQVTVTNQRNNRNMDIAQQFQFDRHQYYVIELVDELKAGSDYVIGIGKFSGNITSDRMGLYKSSYVDTEGVLREIIVSQFSPVFARKALPCFDEPSMKAVFKLTLSHPIEYTALSNTPTSSVQVTSNGWQMTSFMETPIMPTYVAGMVLLDDGYEYRQRIRDDGFQVRVWSRSDVIEQMNWALDLTDRGLSFYEDTFGRKEILTKLDYVAVPTHMFAAMENWGLITANEGEVLYDAETSSKQHKLSSGIITLHECSHMWFGNLVTMKWWGDVWLKEGFASYSMYIAMDHLEPSWKVMETFVVDVFLEVMDMDEMVGSHALSSPGLDDVYQIFDNFDWLAYYKGVSVLRMLEGILGEGVFKLGVQNYLERFKFSNADMADLWAELSKVSTAGLDIEHIMDTWTLQKGFPVLTVNRTSDVSGSSHILVEQEYFVLRPKETQIDYKESQFRYRWDVPFTFTHGNSGSEHVQIHWMYTDSISLPLTSDSENTWLLGNPNLAGYYRVNYDLENWNRIIDQLQHYHEAFSTVNRAGIISDAFALQRAGLLDTDTALRVTLYLDGEFEYEPWYEAMKGFMYLRNRLYLSPVYGSLQLYVTRLLRNIVDNVGWQEQSSDSLRRQLVRDLVLNAACDFGSTECIRTANQAFLDYRLTSNVEHHIALLVLSIGISSGDVEVWNDLWTQSKDADGDERRTMRLALSHSRVPWVIERYMSWCLNTSIMDPSSSHHFFGEVGRSPVGHGLAMDFIADNWQDIVQVYGHTPPFIRTALDTVQLINSEVELQLLISLRERTPKTSAAYHELVKLTEEVKINVEWKTDYENQVYHFLESDAARAKL